MEKKWERPDFYFGEDEFEDRMTMLGKTFRKQVDIDGDFEGCRGVRIHYTYLLHPEERAAVVISHGFCEVMPKYDELIYYFYQLGYSVFFIDHRGHGRSGRCIDHPGKIYVDDFMDYIEDLKTYMDKVVTVFSRSKKYLLFAHSMGGAIGTLFLEHYPDYFQAAVLCAPMIEMQYGRCRSLRRDSSGRGTGIISRGMILRTARPCPAKGMIISAISGKKRRNTSWAEPLTAGCLRPSGRQRRSAAASGISGFRS